MGRGYLVPNYPGTSGNDVFNIGMLGAGSTVSGGGGTDTLNVNWSSLTKDLWGTSRVPSSSIPFPIYLHEVGGLSLEASSIERLNVRFGRGSDMFNAYNSAVIFQIDGGAGSDQLILELTDVTASIT